MKNEYQSVFISDVHIGMRFSNIKLLIKFLESIKCKNLFLVGDIIDGWNLKKWKKQYHKLIQTIIKMWRDGTDIYYVVGNHDEFMRKYLGQYSDVITVTNEYFYTSLNGKKYIVIHGDLFDNVIIRAQWLAKVGDFLYDVVFYINYILNIIRGLFRLKYWSLAQYCKDSVKGVINFIYHFEKLLITHAKENNCDGIICGHIHHPVIKEINGITYCNCGDWIENFSAIVENLDGTFEIELY